MGTLYPHLVLEWDTEKNGLLTPFMFTPGSGEKVWWICNMNHRWQASIVSRTKGSKCPYCSGICVIRGKNDLATLRPDIAAEWNDEKNGELKPCNLKIKSNKKVWWKCKNGHEWQAIISNRTNKNQGCPFCKKMTVKVRIIKSNIEMYISEKDVLRIFIIPTWKNQKYTKE